MGIAIISGASSGIGKALAFELDLLGHDEIWLIARREEKLTEIKEKLKTPVRCFALDLTCNASFDKLRDALATSTFKIDFLVPCAGVGYTGTVESCTKEQIKNTVDLNCSALALTINTALPYMRDGGKIINIASGAGFLPQADFAVYAASKAFVISLSRALRKELKSRKINVCAVCPGPVDTEFFGKLENVKEYKKKYLISPELVAKKALGSSKKSKALCTPTLSMKMLHLCAKVLPTSWLLKFAK